MRVSSAVALTLLAACVCTALLVWASPSAHADPQAVRCPPEADGLVRTGWQAYRADSIAVAAGRFAGAARLCPASLDAQVGLGFAWLRLDVPARAESLFATVAARDSEYVDAWQGLMLSAFRLAHDAVALRAARRVWTLAPGDTTARGVLDRLAPEWDRPARSQRPRAPRLIAQARVQGERFEVPAAGGWTPFYVQGMNLGVALPGRFPAEFPPDSLCYAAWLDSIAATHANAVRVYTILPPAFYRALAAWNTGHPAGALWLVHGVWAELPPRNDFDDPAWKSAFRGEMRSVIRVVHGDADIAPRPGHAGGRYDADVSSWTLAYVIGREWEPFAVARFNAHSRRPGAFAGRYLSMSAGSAMEAWLTEQCDWMLGTEVEGYDTIRPIAYTNWPSLDPLHHPTEASRAEEARWRARVRRPAHNEHLEYDNDAESLDAARVHSTPANPAGWFASYHAYPYYPDFMLYDPAYSQARSSEGPSNYFGYLADLRRHLPGIPLLIAEYGVPSSRGVAHEQPQGWTHGGHDEAAMAAIDARLTREIRESGCAGGILFAWIDEWFKKNWAVIDLELPAEHTPRWHNRLDPEQNYGVLAMDAGPADGPRLGGDVERWLALAALERGPDSLRAGQPAALHVGHDASNLYLAIPLAGCAGRPRPWDSLRVEVALDTYRADLGQHALPGGRITSDIGFEFLLDLRSEEDARLRITPDYDPYLGPRAIVGGDDFGRFYHRPAAPVRRSDGVFDPMYVIVNRARFGRDGTFYPARAWERGWFRFGSEAQSTLSDWYYDAAAGVIEIRIAWALLNVTDPSSATVLDDGATRSGEFGTAHTDGFRIGVLTLRSRDSTEVLGAIPELREGKHWRREDFPAWTWKGWEEPVSHARMKPVFGALKAEWGVFAAGPDSARSVAAAGSPDTSAADQARADSAYAAGRDLEARAAYERVLSRDPRSVRANHRLAILLSRAGRLDSALVLVERARSLDPRDPGTLATEARLLSWAGRFDAALADYDALVRVDPREPEAQLGRARVLGWAGRYAAADSAYAALLTADPRDIAALIGRAQNAAWRGQPEFAEAEYVAALRLDPDNVDALIGLARIRQDQGQLRSAAAQVSRALSLDRENRAANVLSREIRAAQRPQADLAFSVTQDSDHNVTLSRSLSTSLALADGVRGFLTGGSLAASDPTRDATRTMGEAGLQGAYGRAEATLAAGTRWLDPDTGPPHAAPSYRAAIRYRWRSRFNVGAGFARYPLDDSALLIGSDLEIEETQASAEANLGHDLTWSAEAASAEVSDGNRRASGVMALMRDFGRGRSFGVLGRALTYQRQGVGYFSPDHFALAEARGTVATSHGPWTWRLNAGLGAQQVGAGTTGQVAWRAGGQLRYRWAVLNAVEAALGASDSAASSTTGAYRYLTASVGLRLGF